MSLKTWLAQGTGHTVLYSDDCASSDEKLVADILGDVSSSREGLLSGNAGFAQEAVSTVTALSSYAQERSEYDAEFVANSTRVIEVYAERLLENVSVAVPAVLESAYDDIAAITDVLVSCVSLRGDEAAASACPIEGARALADTARTSLDAHLLAARSVLEAYADEFELYIVDVDMAYANMITFYEGVLAFLDANVIDITGVGPWSTMTALDFVVLTPALPVLSTILGSVPDVPTAADVWNEVSGTYSNYSERLSGFTAAFTAEIALASSAYREAAAAAVANISVDISLEDYNPPRFGNSSSEADSTALVGETTAGFQTAADGYYTSSLALLDALGPLASNRSLPVSPSLNSTFVLGGTSTVISSPIAYNFAAFAKKAPNFGSWVVSIANLGVLLVVADYVFRCASSARLFVRFWGRGGLGLPDADLRIDKSIAGAGGVIANARKGAIRIALHPATTLLFFAIVLLLVVYNVAKLYIPLLNDYKAGCVDRTQDGSFFSQNAYSIAYNYAADGGNRDMWGFQVCPPNDALIFCCDEPFSRLSRFNGGPLLCPCSLLLG